MSQTQATAPEPGVQASAPTPGELPARLGARAIDAVVAAALAGTLGQVMGFGFAWLGAGAAMILGYFVAADHVFGATVGKRILGLRVVGPDGGRPSLSQAATREAFTVLGAIPVAGPLLALGAWIWIAMTIHGSALRQGKHDLLAGGTRVVRVTIESRGGRAR